MLRLFYFELLLASSVTAVTSIRVQFKLSLAPATMPITSLPAEILSVVFEHYVQGDEGPGNSPHFLMLVCRQWHQIALTTPSLWSSILVTNRPLGDWDLEHVALSGRISSYNETNHTDSAVQICTTPDRLDTIISRSGTTPLNVTLTSESHRRSANYFYSILFGTQNASRIVQLALDDPDRWNSPLSPSSYLITNPPRLTNLTIIHVFSSQAYSLFLDDHVSLLRVVLEGSKNLREIFMSVKNLCIPGKTLWARTHAHGRVLPSCMLKTSWERACYRTIMQRLQRLQVPFGDVLDLMYGGADVPVLEFTIQTVALVEKAGKMGMWRYSAHPWPRSSLPIITFSHLKSLHLILDDILSLTKLVLPALEDFHLTQSAMSRAQAIHVYEPPTVPPEFILEFPKLRALQVTHSYFAPLNAIHAIQLERLHLTSTLLKQQKTEIDLCSFFFSPDPLAPPRYSGISRLYLNAYISAKIIVTILRLLPQLEFFSLVPGKQLGRALITELTVRIEEDGFPHDILCPMLRALELDFYTFLDWDIIGENARRVGSVTSDRVPVLLKQMVSSRQLGYTH